MDGVLRGDRPPAAPGPGHGGATSTIADRDDLSYEEKLAAYRRLADEYFETERYHDFCASRLAHVDEMVLDWVAVAGVRRAAGRDGARDLPRRTSTSGSSPTSAGWSGQWVREQGARAGAVGLTLSACGLAIGRA